MKKAKIISIILSVVTILLVMASCGKGKDGGDVKKGTPLPVEDPVDTIFDDKNFDFDMFETYVQIASYKGKSKEVEIPAEYNGLPVKAVSEYAFCDNTEITDVTFPSSMVEIGEMAFSGCTSLETVEFNNGLYKIDRNAFSDCSKLTSVSIPKSVDVICTEAFSNCESLETIEIPETVGNIAGGAFIYTKWLDNQTDDFVIVGDGVMVAFNGDGYNVKLPETVKQVSAFYNEFSMESVTFSKSVKSVGESGFKNCNGITEIKLNDGVKSIGDDAFSFCQSLKNVTISSTVETVGNSAFASCTALEKVTFPKSVKSVGNSVFLRCDNLNSVTFENNKVEIGDSCFEASSQNVKIIASADSSAYFYATKNSIKFEKKG